MTSRETIPNADAPGYSLKPSATALRVQGFAIILYAIGTLTGARPLPR